MFSSNFQEQTLNLSIIIGLIIFATMFYTHNFWLIIPLILFPFIVVATGTFIHYVHTFTKTISKTLSYR